MVARQGEGLVTVVSLGGDGGDTHVTPCVVVLHALVVP